VVSPIPNRIRISICFIVILLPILYEDKEPTVRLIKLIKVGAVDTKKSDVTTVLFMIYL